MTSPRRTIDSARCIVRELRLVLGDGLKRVPLLLLLMLGATALDLLGVALIVPFLSLVVGTNLGGGPLSGWWAGLGGMDAAQMGALVLLVFLLKAFATSRVQRRITTITEGQRARLMVRLLAAYQAKPYEFHLHRNSTDLINTVVWYTAAFTGGVLAPLLRLTADGLVVVALGVFLAVSDSRAVLLLAILLAFVFMGVTRAVRTRLSHVAEQSARLHSEVMQSVGQALGAQRESVTPSLVRLSSA